MTPLEKKKNFDAIQKEFNAYKIAGSTLLQAEQIDAKTYYKKVRNKGVQLGLINSDEYPTDLPGIVEPVFRITGATAGAIAGIAGGLPGMSVGAGIGGGAATAVYREFSELLSPDLPLAPMGTKMKEAGLAGGVDFAGMMLFGGAGNVIGRVLGNANKMSGKSMNNLNRLGNERISKIKDGISRKTGFIQKFFISKTDDMGRYADEVANAMEKEGLTPYLGLVTHDTIKSYFQAAGVMPLLGSPVQKIHKEQMNAVVKRLVSDVKTLEKELQREGVNPLLGINSFKWTGKEFERIGPVKDLDYFGATLVQNVTQRLKGNVEAKNKAWELYNKSISSIGNDNKINISNKFVYEKLNKETSLMEMLGLGKGGHSAVANAANKPFPNQGPLVNEMVNNILRKSGLTRGTPRAEITALNGNQMNRLHTSIKDEVIRYRNKISTAQFQTANPLPEDTARLMASLDLKASLEASMQGVRTSAGDDIGILLANANKETGVLATTIKNNKESMRLMGSENTLLKGLYDDIDIGSSEFGNMHEIAGISLPEIRKIGGKGVGDVINKYANASGKNAQEEFKRLLGEKEYKAFVTQELDDIYWEHLLRPEKAGNFEAALPGLNRALGLTGKNMPLFQQRMKAMYGDKADGMVKQFKEVNQVLKYVLSEPNMNNYVVRNAILSKGSIGIGAIGILGFSAGGMVGTFGSLGIMYGVTNFLAKPYSKKLLQQAALGPATSTGREAISKVKTEIQKHLGVADKYNRQKEKMLAITNPSAYKRYTELLKENGVDIGIPGIAGAATATEVAASGVLGRPEDEAGGGPFNRRRIY